MNMSVKPVIHKNLVCPDLCVPLWLSKPVVVPGMLIKHLTLAVGGRGLEDKVGNLGWAQL